MMPAPVPLWRGARKCYGSQMDIALAFEDAEPFRLTVDQFRSLDESGAFDESGRVELIEGMIVCMSPQASIHTTVAFELAVLLRTKLRDLGSPFTAVTTPTIAIPLHNALDPDVGVVLPRAGRDYFPVADARLLIEVSRTSLRKDKRLKRDIYAAAGVPEYWVVDVNKAEVHRFATPRDGVYHAAPPVPLAGELRSLTMPDLAIDGGGIL